MRFYLINLYGADGALMTRLTLPFDTDSEARGHIPALFAAYQECEEIELWEAPRHLQHARRSARESSAGEPVQLRTMKQNSAELGR